MNHVERKEYNQHPWQNNNNNDNENDDDDDDNNGFINLFFKINIFIFILFLAVLDLRCCAWAFSSCSEWASHHGGFSCC